MYRSKVSHIYVYIYIYIDARKRRCYPDATSVSQPRRTIVYIQYIRRIAIEETCRKIDRHLVAHVQATRCFIAGANTRIDMRAYTTHSLEPIPRAVAPLREVGSKVSKSYFMQHYSLDTTDSHKRDRYTSAFHAPIRLLKTGFSQSILSRPMYTLDRVLTRRDARSDRDVYIAKVKMYFAYHEETAPYSGTAASC